MLQTKNGEKALPGSGQRIFVDDWNKDGIQDLIIGASVATVDDGEFSDELSWEWEDVNDVESAGKDPGLYPPRERPTLENQRKMFEELAAQRIAEGTDESEVYRPTDEQLLEQLSFQQEYWDKKIGRLYDEGKEHWLTMRHQGRIYVMLGKKREKNTTASFSQGSSSTNNQTALMTEAGYPVKVTLQAPDALRAGESTELTVDFEMKPGWYIYAPTGRNTSQGMVETTVRFDYPESISASGGIKLPLMQYKGVFDIFQGTEVRWKQPVAASSSANGERTIECEVTFQTCKDDLCLPSED